MKVFVFIVLLLATRSLGKPVQYFRVGVVFSKGSKTLASVHNVERYVSRSQISINAKPSVQVQALARDRTISIVRCFITHPSSNSALKRFFLPTSFLMLPTQGCLSAGCIQYYDILILIIWSNSLPCSRPQKNALKGGVMSNGPKSNLIHKNGEQKQARIGSSS